MSTALLMQPNMNLAEHPWVAEYLDCLSISLAGEMSFEERFRIRAEVLDHIEAAVQDSLADCMSLNAAVVLALRRMGPPESVAESTAGFSAHRQSLLQRHVDPGPAVAILLLQLILVGIAFLRASTAAPSTQQYLVDPSAFRAVFGNWIPAPEATISMAILAAALLAGPAAGLLTSRRRFSEAANSFLALSGTAAGYSMVFGLIYPQLSELRLAAIVQALIWVPCGCLLAAFTAERRLLQSRKFTMPEAPQ